MSSNTSEESDGGGGGVEREKPCDVAAAPTGIFAWKGVGVSGAGDAFCSIQKSQEATRDRHGQVTFHFPSSSL